MAISGDCRYWIGLRRRKTDKSGGSGTQIVACLAVHPPCLAATRLRLAQYFDFLEEAGLSCELWTFLSESNLPMWYGRSHLARLAVILRCLMRIPRALVLIMRADVVIVQRECVPFGPPVLEWVASRVKPLVWDVDDFVWVPYDSPTAGRVTRWFRTSERKHSAISRWATEVWAGSGAIAEWAMRRSPHVVYVPTVLPVPAEPAARRRRRSAAWVGSHSTAPFLEAVLPWVGRCKNLEEITVVGATVRSEAADGMVRQEPWSPSTERAACESSRVGLYPIDRSQPQAEGKCGLKAILYMSYGLPCVLTPTGPNKAVVRDGVEGFHAETPEDWHVLVERLLVDDALWERCSRAAHRRARKDFSLEAWGPAITRRVRSLLA